MQVRATKPNYESVSASADVVVNPATITVTANNQTKIAGETDPELTYTFAGAVKDEIARFAGGLQREAGEEAGVYAINQGDLVLVDQRCLQNRQLHARVRVRYLHHHGCSP